MIFLICFFIYIFPSIYDKIPFFSRVKISHGVKCLVFYIIVWLDQCWEVLFRDEKSVEFWREGFSNLSCYWFACRDKITREMKIWHSSPHINRMMYSLNQSNLFWLLLKPFFHFFSIWLGFFFSLAKEFYIHWVQIYSVPDLRNCNFCLESYISENKGWLPVETVGKS